MPINMRMLFSPDDLNGVKEPKHVAEFIRRTMHASGVEGAPGFANARRFCLMKLIEIGKVELVLAYILGEGLIPGL